MLVAGLIYVLHQCLNGRIGHGGIKGVTSFCQSRIKNLVQDIRRIVRNGENILLGNAALQAGIHLEETLNAVCAFSFGRRITRENKQDMAGVVGHKINNGVDRFLIEDIAAAAVAAVVTAKGVGFVDVQNAAFGFFDHLVYFDGRAADHIADEVAGLGRDNVTNGKKARIMGDAADKMDRSCFTGPGVSGEEDTGQMRTGGPDCGAGSFETLGHQAVGFRRCRRCFDGFQNAVQLSGDALPSGAVLEDIPWVKRKLAKILAKEHAQKSIIEDAGSTGPVQLLTDAAVQRTQRKSGTTLVVRGCLALGIEQLVGGGADAIGEC